MLCACFAPTPRGRTLVILAFLPLSFGRRVGSRWTRNFPR